MRIKILVMDVDGTLTDGMVYMGSSGELFKAFNVKDGYGIRNILLSNNIVPVIITGRKSKILENRCNELGINEIYQGIDDKITILKNIAQKYNVDFSNIAYIGDDLNDYPCMLAIKEAKGMIGCPADAVKAILEISNFVSSKNGGAGAVRDFIDYLVPNA